MVRQAVNVTKDILLWGAAALALYAMGALVMALWKPVKLWFDLYL